MLHLNGLSDQTKQRENMYAFLQVKSNQVLFNLSDQLDDI
jgi:hypothetical protein